MNKRVKAKWLKALRSGEYSQGKGSLARSSGDPNVSDTFCCLGVLCDLAVQAGVIPYPTLKNSSSQYTYGEGDMGNFYLPIQVRSWAGLDSGDPMISNNLCTKSLSEMNDGEELSFKKIANVIEEKL